MVDWILGTAIGVAWGISLIVTYEAGRSRTYRRVFHQIAWGRYRGSGKGIVEDHGNCIDHGDCPYD